MLIYAIADIHGRQERLALIKKNVKEYNPDLLVVAGDITNYFQPAKTIKILSSLSIPVLIVRGNSDFPVVERLAARTANIHSLHVQTFSKNSINFIGLSGAIPIPFRTRVCFQEKRIFGKILPLLTERSILVMHPPPYGIVDRVLGKLHAGSRCLYEVILQRQPMLCICGHIHEDIGKGDIGKTLVVNCSIGKMGEGAMIQLLDGKAPKVNFLVKK